VVVRRWWVWGAAVLVVLAGVLAWVLWPSGAPVPRARPYLAFTACLLTDGQGVTGPRAAPVWAGMQDASLSTHAKVQFLQVTGEGTVANAQPYVASLVQRKCAVVVAVGTAQVGAVLADAPKYPGVRFVVLGPAGDVPGVTSVDASAKDGGRARVAALVEDAVRASGSS
jgi:hypothetical protein